MAADILATASFCISDHPLMAGVHRLQQGVHGRAIPGVQRHRQRPGLGGHPGQADPHYGWR
jgi:hypothetical protein